MDERMTKPIIMDDLAIARAVPLKPIETIAERLGIPQSVVYRYGPYKAKIALDFLNDLHAQAYARRGKLILVTAISPTPAGEGKTTTSIGLGDALSRIGQRTAICLREPSLGPCLGSKGGATGGGHAQIAPMDEINLHFTGDLHAIGAANNLLAALIDNHVFWGNALGIDTRRVSWRRAMDLNDRALREVIVGLGGPNNGYPRSTGFDITVASEVMAIFCLASSLADLDQKLGSIIVAEGRKSGPVKAADLQAAGAMTALLKDAFAPNLVQTLEGTPTFVHGGPFANIAHGCNSALATRSALALADFVVTEAGFGADLGAEKFLDIKCRKTGLAPSAAVVVATIRALKMHGGVALGDLGKEDVDAVERGAVNLARHIENLKKFNLPVLVALNRFSGDTPDERKAVIRVAENLGARVFDCSHWANGGAGAEDLARAVVEVASGERQPLKLLYPDDMPLAEKIRTIATEIYRASDIQIHPDAAKRLADFEKAGYGNLPICIAKTQYSFSADPNAKGAPSGHIIPVREVRLSAGAGFVVALCGDIMTMPGLPRNPAAHRIHVGASGQIEGVS
jgi:formate--tetrahydrofolate ligase